MTNSYKPQPHFDDVYSELEYYKAQSLKHEGDISKLQTQIQKLESSNKKLQESNALNGKNINNTSISFFLPSEFTILWERFIKVELLEALDSFIENFALVAHIAQDIMLITYKHTDLLIKSKVDLILKRLNIKEVPQEQKDKLLLKFLSFFQEHFAEIFILDKELNGRIKEEVRRVSNGYVFKWNKEMLKEEISKASFDKVIMSVFKVCLYMLLHEPILTLDIKEYAERKLKYSFFNKKDFINIEGFGNERTPCVVVLPPPMLRKKFPYSDLKAAVYSLNEANEEIMAECEKNQTELKKPRSLAQTPLLSKIDTSGDIQGRPKESPLTPKMNAVTKSITGQFGVMQNMSTASFRKEKGKSPASAIPSGKKDNDDMKARRNYDHPMLVKSSAINKQVPSVYTAKAFIPVNNQTQHQITKEISGEITPLRYNYNNNASTLSGYNRNDPIRDNDRLRGLNSMQNWNRTESNFKRESPLASNITLSPDSFLSKMQKQSVYSIPSFNVVRNKNTYTIDNTKGSLAAKPQQPPQYSYETKQQTQAFTRTNQRESNQLNKECGESSLLNYANYPYENSKQKEFFDTHKEHKDDHKRVEAIPPPRQYIKPRVKHGEDRDLISDQKYSINQMKLDDLRYKYPMNDFKDSTPRGENLAKYAIGNYYYKKKYNI